jgi:hypothetical protein
MYFQDGYDINKKFTLHPRWEDSIGQLICLKILGNQAE